ncbi:hypothetical protein NBRC110019_26180 [Neptunitalea chrysea]|uniref:PKD domain-containing protein n=1 Tax=Neptunitalea chrysea TaxID=1647581 RepID=A0A9W6B8J7_9FLAO|nr:T9SS type B sorting domain-containing protein [Neptunitalea chrysea]GLB53577.1 hypothetical protein NBRC110019_26180 [Neptunitalea chrysea]
MLKKYFFLIILTLSVNIVKSQVEAINWYFGQNAGIAFDPITYDFIGTVSGSLATLEGCASISDSNGILFYTDGTTVYNANDNIMPNGTGLNGNSSSTQSAIIVPFVDDNTKYYIFTVDDNGGPFSYTVVDMTLDGGNGDVDTSQLNVTLLPNTTEKICVTEIEDSENGYWVITYGPSATSTSNYNRMYAYKLTNTGIDTSPVISTFGYTTNEERGYLKISPDGTKIACATLETDRLYLYDFNATTGVVTNELQLGIATAADYPYGIEFSPDSSLLYCAAVNSSGSGGSGYTSSLIQYDLQAADIVMSQVEIYTGSGYRGALQLGPDRKIYRTVPDGYSSSFATSSLSVINNPNQLGTACNYVEDDIDLSFGGATQGLPPFISSIFNASFDHENLCYGETTQFTLEVNNLNDVDSVVWHFDDPSSGTNNVSLDINPTHVFTQPGNYNVTIEVLYTDGSTSDESENVTIYQTPTIVNVSDWLACTVNLNGNYTFDFTEKDNEATSNNSALIATYYHTFTDAENDTDPITTPYNYTSNVDEVIYVKVINPLNPNCSYIDSFTISTAVEPVINAMTDITACEDIDYDYINIDLTDKITEAYGTQSASDFDISFHTSQGDAENGINPISVNHTNDEDDETIYVRLENTDHHECYSIGTFTIIIFDTPVPGQPVDIYACLDATTGTADFDVSDVETILKNGTHPENIDITTTSLYYDENGNIIGDDGLASPFTSGSQTITAQLTNSHTQCTSTGTMDNFTYNGDAFINATNDLIQLTQAENTPDANGNMGSAWSNIMIDLTNDFSIDAELFFGTYDSGADGIAFVLQPLTVNAGSVGGGLGYQGISPSLAVEFDTYANGTDPIINDHVAIISDGQANVNSAHSEFTAPADLGNIEDNFWHDVNITYDSTTQTFTVTLDGTIVQTATIDLVNDIFGGSSYVYWGFTGSTGAATNTQQVIINNFCVAQEDIGCPEYVTFNLIAVPEFTMAPIDQIEECDDDNDGFITFDTSNIQSLVESNFTNLDRYEIEFYDGNNDFIAATFPSTYYNVVANTETITVGVTDILSGCYVTNTFDLIVNPKPEIIVPTPLYGCNNGTGNHTFLLNEKTAEILNGQSDISVLYYDSMTDLISGAASLPNAYTSSTPTHTIYVKLVHNITGCWNSTTLELIIMDPPTVNTPNELAYCDDDNDGFGEFDIQSIYSSVIPNDSYTYNVSIHETHTDAENDVNQQYSPYENIYPDTQTLHVRVENTTTGCYSIVPLQLYVHPTPEVSYDLPALELCDDEVADGLTEFDLSLQDEDVYGSQSISDYTVSYYGSYNAAALGMAALPNYYTNSTPYLQTIWVRLEDNLTGCPTIRSFDLIVNPNPVIDTNYDNDLALCDDFGEIGDEITVFDLTVENDEITGGFNGYAVTYYETLADAKDATNVVPDDTAYTNTLGNPSTLYVRVEDLNTGCYSTTSVTLRVLNNPSPLTDIDPIETCDDDLDGDENNGQAEFDLTIYEEALLNGETDVTAAYYETYNDAYNATNAISNSTAYYNITPDLQTIYVAVTNNNTGCLTIVDFDLIVNPSPDVVDETTYYLCEKDNDDEESILLTDMDNWVMQGADTSGYVITYYETEVHAINDEYEYAGPSITITGTEDIAVRVVDTLTGCIQTLAYTIDIEQAPLANTPRTYAICESLGSDGYYNNDGVEVFDLTTKIDEIMAGQSQTAYTITFYTSYDNALNQENPMDDTDIATYETGSTTVYAVVTNNNTGCTNGEPIAVELIVEPLPEVTLNEQTGIICTDATNNPILGTDLGEGYEYAWNNGATTPTLEATEGGEYYVTVTNTNTINQCSYETNHIYFDEASLPSVTPTVLQSEMFNGDNTIEVIAEGVGASDYSFQLDDDEIQYTGLFTDVQPGVHSITITELNGCGTLKLEVSVIDYMKYFTPNGDGVNDTWKVIGLENQTNAQIFIFDRQGKMVKQMSSTSEGWNGTYNGNMLPSSDYWFKVVYTEPNSGKVKEFNSHFSLKR